MSTRDTVHLISEEGLREAREIVAAVRQREYRRLPQLIEIVCAVKLGKDEQSSRLDIVLPVLGIHDPREFWGWRLEVGEFVYAPLERRSKPRTLRNMVRNPADVPRVVNVGGDLSDDSAKWLGRNPIYDRRDSRFGREGVLV